MTSSRDGDDPPKRHLRLASPAAYEVGYGKPPTGSQFKPGRSGNPKGRARGAKNRLPSLSEERLKSIVLEEAYRIVKVRDGGKNVSVPMATAIVRAVAVNAAKGNNRAAQHFTQMVKVVEDENMTSHREYVRTMIDYKYVWEQEIEHCRKHGLPLPQPIPHPDDIRINFNTGEVQIVGPFCKEDIPKWETIRERKAECDREISRIKDDLKLRKMQKYREILLRDLAHEQRIREIVYRLLPD